MGIPLISLIPKVVKVAASILGVDSVKDVVDALQNNKLTPEQRLALDAAEKQFEVEMRQADTEQMKQFVAEAVAEITSSDKFVSRARPAGLYLAYFFTGIVVVAAVFGTLEKELIQSVLLLLAPFWGSGGYYMHLRTKEKMNGGNGD